MPRSICSPAPPPADATAHPAVKAYTLAFKSTPNEVQVQQIIATVTNQAAWARVLLAWRSHGWREGDVANMLDRYLKDTFKRGAAEGWKSDLHGSEGPMSGLVFGSEFGKPTDPSKGPY